MEAQRNNREEKVSAEALEDIRYKVVPMLGIHGGGDEIIQRVADKHKLDVEHVIRIAKNMKKGGGE
jgi:hypothetical protein